MNCDFLILLGKVFKTLPAPPAYLKLQLCSRKSLNSASVSTPIHGTTVHCKSFGNAQWSMSHHKEERKKVLSIVILHPEANLNETAV